MSTPEKKPPAGGGGSAPEAEQKPKAEEKSLAERAKSGEKLTPEELATVTGNTVNLRPTVTVSGTIFRAVKPNAVHQGAAQLHGWAAHEHHGDGPLKLTITDYQRALEAAAKGLPPYGPACAAKNILPKAHQLRAQAQKAVEQEGSK